MLAINPLRERGFANFSDPKNIGELIADTGIAVADRIYQVRIGGDLAALKGVMKALAGIRAPRPATCSTMPLSSSTPRAWTVDRDLDSSDWQDLDAALAAWPKRTCATSPADTPPRRATMLTWCMGLTHHPKPWRPSSRLLTWRCYGATSVAAAPA